MGLCCAESVPAAASKRMRWTRVIYVQKPVRISAASYSDYSHMQITFWGAARTVTGSMHHVETGGKRYLLDCGMYQGKRQDAFERNSKFPFPPSDIAAVILSH